VIYLYKYYSEYARLSLCSLIVQSAFSSRLGYEEHIPGQTRDWNEELQTTRELPQKNLPERLIRERAIFKVTPPFYAFGSSGGGLYSKYGPNYVPLIHQGEGSSQSITEVTFGFWMYLGEGYVQVMTHRNQDVFVQKSTFHLGASDR